MLASIGHVRVAFCLCLKMSPRAKLYIRKRAWFAGKSRWWENIFWNEWLRARRLVLVRWQQKTQKWQIVIVSSARGTHSEKSSSKPLLLSGSFVSHLYVFIQQNVNKILSRPFSSRGKIAWEEKELATKLLLLANWLGNGIKWHWFGLKIQLATTVNSSVSEIGHFAEAVESVSKRGRKE